LCQRAGQQAEHDRKSSRIPSPVSPDHSRVNLLAAVTMLGHGSRGTLSDHIAHKEDRGWSRDCISIGMTQLVEFLQWNKPSSKENDVSK